MRTQDKGSERLALGASWLHAPTHYAWMDGDLLTGDGVVVEEAPESFLFAAESGLERMRFGRVIAPHSNGCDAPMPVLPDRLDAIIRAAEQIPGENIFLEAFNDEANPEKAEAAWRDFFVNAVEYMALDALDALEARRADVRAYLQELHPLSRFADLLSLNPNADMGYTDKTVIDEAMEVNVFETLGIDLAMQDAGLSGEDFQDQASGGLSRIVANMAERGAADNDEYFAVQELVTHVRRGLRQVAS